MLATLLRPTAGSARVLGHDVVEEAKLVRRKVSLTGQFASVDEDLTGIENLMLVARLLGMGWKAGRARAEELLAAFGLAEAGGRLVRTFSGGMRRRMDIAASLVTTPELLFLDEPTTGLDPRSRGQVWDIVRSVAAAGTTVLLTTQYLEEVDKLAERMAVIDQGRVIAEGTSRELKASVGANALRLHLTEVDTAEAATAAIATVDGTEPALHAEAGELTLKVADTDQVADILRALSHAGIGVAEFSLGRPSLDDVFFALTGHAAEDPPTAEVSA